MLLYVVTPFCTKKFAYVEKIFVTLCVEDILTLTAKDRYMLEETCVESYGKNQHCSIFLDDLYSSSFKSYFTEG